MFLALRTMPVESHEYRRQRECIVKRCLPLADHVARHFGRRGESLDDLTQVARLGLMNAIQFDDAARVAAIMRHALDESHLLLMNAGTYGTSLRLMPPLVVTANEIDIAITALQHAVKATA